MMLYAFLFRDCKNQRIYRLVNQMLWDSKILPILAVFGFANSLGGEDGFIEEDDSMVLTLQVQKPLFYV